MLKNFLLLRSWICKEFYEYSKFAGGMGNEVVAAALNRKLYAEKMEQTKILNVMVKYANLK